MRKLLSVLVGLVLLSGVALAVALAVVPTVVGGSVLTVRSGSMEPALPVGGVVVIRPRPAGEIAVGDVITFTARDTASSATRVVTHRVIAVEPGPAFRTKGDANPDPDPGLTVAADVRGVEWYALPWVGSAASALRTPGGLVAAGGVVLLVLAVGLLTPRRRSTAGV